MKTRTKVEKMKDLLTCVSCFEVLDLKAYSPEQRLLMAITGRCLSCSKVYLKRLDQEGRL
jgi:hypothetical protein